MTTQPTHTPGPWIVDEFTIETAGTAKDSFHYTIAEINIDDEMEGDPEANALLIAAAPELLGALKRLAEAREVGVYTQEQLERLLKDAKQAIARAEGK